MQIWNILFPHIEYCLFGEFTCDICIYKGVEAYLGLEDLSINILLLNFTFIVFCCRTFCSRCRHFDGSLTWEMKQIPTVGPRLSQYTDTGCIGRISKRYWRKSSSIYVCMDQQVRSKTLRGVNRSRYLYGSTAWIIQKNLRVGMQLLFHTKWNRWTRAMKCDTTTIYTYLLR